MSIQTYGAVFFMLIKQILHDVNYAEVTMMPSFGK